MIFEVGSLPLIAADRIILKTVLPTEVFMLSPHQGNMLGIARKAILPFSPFPLSFVLAATLAVALAISAIFPREGRAQNQTQTEDVQTQTEDEQTVTAIFNERLTTGEMYYLHRRRGGTGTRCH